MHSEEYKYVDVKKKKRPSRSLFDRHLEINLIKNRLYTVDAFYLFLAPHSGMFFDVSKPFKISCRKDRCTDL